MKVTKQQRVFYLDDKVLPDVDPSLTPEKVKEHYENVYPQLINSYIEYDEKNSTKQERRYHFKKSSGNFG